MTDLTTFGALARETMADLIYSMGYRDAAEGRMKWHLPHCKDHGDHETGCQS